MGGAHSHGVTNHDLDDVVDVGRLPRLLLLVVLAGAALATVVGTLVLWPGDDRPEPVQYAGEGVTFPSAEVVAVSEPCPVIIADPQAPPTENAEFPEHCNELTARLLDGDRSGETVVVQVPPYVARSGLVAGDGVELVQIPGTQDRPGGHGWVGVQRNLPLGALALVFVVVVGLVARLRGLMALVGLGFAGFVVATFMLPALLSGESGTGVALAGSSAIMFVVLYLTHGLSVRTSTALAGTLVGILIIAGIGIWGVHAARLSGIGDDSGEILMMYAPDLDYQGLLTSAVIIAGLGVLNDVTITQSSAVWELRAAAPGMSRAKLFTSGMRIGRDHIASTIYTIVFAYAGTALAVILLLSLYQRPLLDTLTDESIAAEVVRTLASAIGLVLAVPATTAIAALTVSGPRPVVPSGRQ